MDVLRSTGRLLVGYGIYAALVLLARPLEAAAFWLMLPAAGLVLATAALLLVVVMAWALELN